MLDDLAHKFGTDKRTGIHAYSTHYENRLEGVRHRIRKVLEIGIAEGASLRMWEEYFPNAVIFAMDINPDCRQFESPRTRILIADQDREEDLVKVRKIIGDGMDLIIDDGGHRMNQQLMSFKTLFPSLRSGGTYVVEDVHTSYWGDMGGGYRKSGTMVEFLKGLVDDVNKSGIGYGDHDRALAYARERGTELSEYSLGISSIQFFPSIVFVERR